jgi:hypothetical protein
MVTQGRKTVGCQLSQNVLPEYYSGLRSWLTAGPLPGIEWVVEAVQARSSRNELKVRGQTKRPGGRHRTTQYRISFGSMDQNDEDVAS